MATKPETSDAADPRPSVTLYPATPGTTIDLAPASGPAVYRAIAAVTDALGKEGIAKSRQSGGENSRAPKFMYRGIDQVYAALSPLLALHNLCILPRVTSRDVIERKSSSGNALFYTTLTVEFDFVSSIDGSKHTACVVGEAMDSGDKGSNKALSIAYKYAAFLTFCIPVEGDEDPDSETHEVRSQTQPPQQQTKSTKSAEPTEDEMRAAFKRGEDLLKAAKTADAVKTIWDTKIEWDTIPKSWTKQMQKVASETIAAITAAKQRPIVPPNFGPETDDDIPF